jgi:hypothetical protein
MPASKRCDINRAAPLQIPSPYGPRNESFVLAVLPAVVASAFPRRGPFRLHKPHDEFKRRIRRGYQYYQYYQYH